jgi:general secretion pathway protein B
MSYILDAIKKSEQQRQRTEVPTLQHAQMAAVEDTRPSFLLIGIVAAILVISGILIGWLVTWRHNGDDAKPAHLGSNEAKPVQSAAIASGTPRTAAEEKNATLENSATSGGSKPVFMPHSMNLNAVLSKTNARGVTVETITAANKPGGAPEREPGINAGSHEAKGSKEVVSLEELPLSIQKEIPDISISGYSYSSSSRERIVGINDRLLQEGEYLARGLKVERIGANGVVFSYKNYYFRKSF